MYTTQHVVSRVNKPLIKDSSLPRRQQRIVICNTPHIVSKPVRCVLIPKASGARNARKAVGKIDFQGYQQNTKNKQETLRAKSDGKVYKGEEPKVDASSIPLYHYHFCSAHSTLMDAKTDHTKHVSSCFFFSFLY